MINIKTEHLTCVILALMFLSFSSLSAQSGKVGINTTSPQAMLTVQDSSVLFITGEPTGMGLTPVSGYGTRMMWFSGKAAFRTGKVNGSQWDAFNIGFYSVAGGFATKASGDASFAMGVDCIASGESSVALGSDSEATNYWSMAIGNGTDATGIASFATGSATDAIGNNSLSAGVGSRAAGDNSVAMGSACIANGNNSIAMGQTTLTSGINSFAMGNATKASGVASSAFGTSAFSFGNNSVALGFNTKAKPYASLVIGRYNDTTAISHDTWNALDPVFIIGNGTVATRANAFTVLKNGNTGISTSTPGAKLDVQGSTILGVSGSVITNIIKETITDDVSSIAGGTTTYHAFSVPSTTTGSTVFVSPENNLDAGLIIAFARVSSPGIVHVAFTNTTGVPINLPSMDYYITVIK